MPATDHRYLIMNHLSTRFLITALVIVVHQGSEVTASNGIKVDQVAQESRNRAVTIIESPKYVAQPQFKPQTLNTSAVPSITAVPPSNTAAPVPNIQPDQRPPSKPPITLVKAVKQLFYTNIPRPYYGHVQKIPPQRPYAKQPLLIYHSPNSIYKFPRVIPLPPHLQNHYFLKPRPLLFAASNVKPTIAKSPKFSLPAQIINGIRIDVVRPPKSFNTTINSTTTTSTEATTTKVLRTKRIWPKRELDKENTTVIQDNTIDFNISDETDRYMSDSSSRGRYVYRNGTQATTVQPLTTRGYRPVTRTPKIKYTTPSNNFTDSKLNDWVPIMPSHYARLRKPIPTPINKRSDVVTNSELSPGKQTLYLQSFGLVPVSKNPQKSISRKKMILFNRKRQMNPYVSGYSRKPGHSPSQYVYRDLQTEGSRRYPRVVTKIKHHHHHHHHRYIKTVEKPVKVPYRVEVPKPYPVQVEKKVPYPVEKIKVVEKPVPYPVTVEKKVPYPIGIRIPHPVPVKVVEKEYIPKPYPIIHHVPVIKHVQVEKKVPYPVEVKVPVDRPVPVPVPVEKQVPYPVPVKVLVPQPYPVETRVPYPVHVKVREPVEVIKHVQVKVPYPQPYPVKVYVEKKIPYPVEVEKKVPVEVYVPQRVEVEKRVPVYVPKPYPVEKKVPYPVKVPVRVPVHVPMEVPVYIHNPIHIYSDDYANDGALGTETVTASPVHTVTVHGNTGFAGFQSRSDKPETITTTAASHS